MKKLLAILGIIILSVAWAPLGLIALVCFIVYLVREKKKQDTDQKGEEKKAK